MQLRLKPIVPMVSLLFVLSISCSIAFDGPQSEGSESKPSEPNTETPSPSENWKQDFLMLVNDLRKSGCRCGNENMPPVAPLALDERLTQAAQIHADDMAKNKFFNHTGSDGSKVSDRANRVGFKWMNIGENISAGYPNFQGAFQGWKESPGHCKNMMGKAYEKMGVAHNGAKWVQTLGNPRGN